MEEALNNQVDKMTVQLMSVRLSLSTPMLTEWAHECSSHDGRDEDYAWIKKYRLAHIKADLAMPLMDCQPLSSEDERCL